LTIVAQSDIRYQPFSGSTDPSLPIGYWQCSVNGIGDASAGLSILRHTLVPSGQADPSLWSLEQLGLQHDAATDVTKQIEVSNVHNPNDPATPITVTFQFTHEGGQNSRSGLFPAVGDFLPYFIGRSAGREANAQLFFDIVVTNVDGVAFRSMLFGYRWGGRAYDTPTGPRAPAGGIFRG